MLLLLLACQTPPPQTQTVAAAPGSAAPVQAAPEVTIEDLNALRDEVDARLGDLEIRAGALELEVQRLQEGYEAQATQIGYDPSRTTLDARDVQAAVDELARDVKGLQERSGQNMGQPGQALFDIPEDDAGSRPPPKDGPGSPNSGPPGQPPR